MCTFLLISSYVAAILFAYAGIRSVVSCWEDQKAMALGIGFLLFSSSIVFFMLPITHSGIFAVFSCTF
jgi:hypothetical protein